MAKTAKVKNKAPSIHSRAARRAASPSLNIDKSIKEITPPRHTQSSFFSVQNGGIKKRKNKPLSRQQKLRHQKGVERADTVKEQNESKVQKSLGKLKRVKERRKDWDDLNAKLESQVTKGGIAALADILDIKEGDGSGATASTIEQAAVRPPREEAQLAEVLPLRSAAEGPSYEEEDDVL